MRLRLFTRLFKPTLTTLLGFLAASAAADTVRNILVFGDSNTWGWVPQATAFPTERYPRGTPWPDVMAAALGPTTRVVVDALSGRTVDVDYPAPQGSVPGDGFNGARALPAAIARELPLDLVIVMLGTNDVRGDLDRSPEMIARGIAGLAAMVRGAAGGVYTTYPAPALLVVVPPPVEDTSRTPIHGVMDGAQGKSRALAPAVQAALEGTGVAVFDAGMAVRIEGIDGVHMSEANHAALGQAVAAEVERLLAAAN